jgi:hypothetical protein
MSKGEARRPAVTTWAQRSTLSSKAAPASAASPQSITARDSRGGAHTILLTITAPRIEFSRSLGLFPDPDLKGLAPSE